MRELLLEAARSNEVSSLTADPPSGLLMLPLFDFANNQWRVRHVRVRLLGRPAHGARKTKRCEHYITLSGGSLGSCVDEERSQLRELM